MTLYLRFSTYFLFFLLVTLCVGCGGRVRVRGEVTFEGKPLEQGTISFVKLARPEIKPVEIVIRDGKYDTHIAPGYYSVQINSWQDGPDGKVNIIPKLYNTNSLLALTPNDDPENLNFKLIKNVTDGFGNK